MKLNCLKTKSGAPAPLGLLLALTLLMWSFACLSAAPSTQITVHANRPIGVASENFRTGVFLSSLPTGYAMDKFFKDQKPGMIELSWQFYPYLMDSSTLEEFKQRLPNSALTEWAKRTAAAGGHVHLLLMPVPKWLRARPNAGWQIPSSWAGWEEYVKTVVDYFSNQLHLNASYIVWDEPDMPNVWKGSADDYLQMYRHSVIGARRATPSAHIGGPAIAGFLAPFNKDQKGAVKDRFIERFVRYCREQNLPIDALVWHTFNALPLQEGSYHKEVAKARILLAQNGFPKNTKLLLASWNILTQHPGMTNYYHDDEFSAAYAASTVITLEQAGFDNHTFFNLFEDWRETPPNTTFANELGMLTKDFIAKPVYNAFIALNSIQGNKLHLKHDIPSVQAVAVEDAGKIVLLVSRFVPPVPMVRQGVYYELLLTGATKSDLARNHFTVEEWQATAERLRKNPAMIEQLSLPEDTKEVLRRILAYIENYEHTANAIIDLTVLVDGLAQKQYILEHFIIDKDNLNSLAYRQRIDSEIRAIRSKMPRDLEQDQRSRRSQGLEPYRDKLQTLNELVRFKPARRDTVSTSSHRLELRLSLQPYSVHLIKLSRGN